MVLKSDVEKVEYLTSVIDEDAEVKCVNSTFRLGKRASGRTRHLLVRFRSVADRNSFLFNQKKLRNSQPCRENFGVIYVNRDASFLVKKEEKRLRDKKNRMLSTLKDGDRLYIRKDSLYLNDDIIDSIDISKQLF